MPGFCATTFTFPILFDTNHLICGQSRDTARFPRESSAKNGRGFVDTHEHATRPTLWRASRPPTGHTPGNNISEKLLCLSTGRENVIPDRRCAPAMLTTLCQLSEKPAWLMSNFNHDEWRQNRDATENLQSLKKWQLKKHLQYFTKARPQLTFLHQQMRDDCKERIELLRREIDQRRVIKPAWIAAIAGIAAVILAILLLVQDCSRSSPITSEARPTPTATPQQSATPSEPAS